MQTVGRGELFALLVLVKHLPFLADIKYITDNEPLYNTYSAGPKAGANGANCDLYEELIGLIYAKALRISVRWMPSHLREGDERPLGVSELDVIANAHADKLAGQAAAAEEISPAIAMPYLKSVSLVSSMQRRLAIISLYLPPREKKQRESAVRAPRPKVDDLLHKTDHTISVSGNRYACDKCYSSFRIADPSLKIWLQSKCMPVLFDSRGILSPTAREDTFHIGNNITHASHELYFL